MTDNYHVELVLTSDLCIIISVDSEWSSSPEGIHPTLHYFCRNKLLVWSNVAEQAMEACIVSTKLVSKYFEQFRQDVVSQLVGINYLAVLYDVN